MMRLYFVWRFISSLVSLLAGAAYLVYKSPVIAWEAAREDVRMKEILG